MFKERLKKSLTLVLLLSITVIFVFLAKWLFGLLPEVIFEIIVTTVLFLFFLFVIFTIITTLVGWIIEWVKWQFIAPYRKYVKDKKEQEAIARCNEKGIGIVISIHKEDNDIV